MLAFRVIDFMSFRLQCYHYGVRILCGMQNTNAEFDHVYFAELQVRNVCLSVGSRELL